jgi:uncharacterized protein with HEPN domain
MNERTADRLYDIVKAIDRSEGLLHGKTQEEFASDILIRAAYARFLEIVCEASRHLPAELKDEFPNIPWRDIANLGNRLRHAYSHIDVGIMWAIYEKRELKELRTVAVEPLGGTGGGQ